MIPLARRLPPVDAPLLTTALAVTVALAVVGLGLKGLAVVVGLAGAAAILLFPRFGLLLTILVVINIQAAGRFDNTQSLIFMSVAKIVGGLTLLAWFLHTALARRRPVFTWQMGIGALFLLLCAVSLLQASHLEMAVADLVKTVANFLLYFLIANLVDSPRMVRRVFGTLLVATAVACIVAFMQEWLPSFQVSGLESVIHFGVREAGVVNPENLISGPFIRVSGTFGHSNWFSFFLTAVLPLPFLFLGRGEPRPVRLAAAVLLAAMLLCVVLTHDRIGFLGAVVVLTGLVWRRLVPVPGRLLPAAVVLLLVTAPLLLPATYRERVFSPHHYQKSASISARAELQIAGLELFGRHFLTGVGVGNFGPAFMSVESKLKHDVQWLLDRRSANFQDYWMAAHNLYLEVACETGIFGLLALLAFWGRGFADLGRARRLLAGRKDFPTAMVPLALQISMVGFAVAATLIHVQHQKIWWILMGLTVALRRLAEEESAVVVREGERP